ncbi:MAG: family efflux transporter [Anaerocolumna sp.]|jgi:putative MATE family efflux protein|nr:family efflux transporter [Anaerocolumna sp.]
MFSKQQLYKLIVPLIIEQIFAVTVGMADVIMVARVGEAAVSGVALVDTLNILLINIFSALATGGAVVAAQYLGQKDEKNASKSAGQLLLSAGAIAIVITLISLVGNKIILRQIYGSIDANVMQDASLYFYFTALSFPFLAIYNSGAALFRAMGNSKISMMVSLIMNIINVVGNAIMIFGFHAGVEGVAIPTLISRVVAAVTIIALLHNKELPIHIKHLLHIGFHWIMIKRILRIGIPNSLENSMFQVGKILVQGLIASYGTAAISANAISNNIASIGNIPGAAIGLSMITVVGQCVGANDYHQAKQYTIKLMRLSYIIMFFLNVLIIFLAKPMIGLYGLSELTSSTALQIVIYHSIACVIFWPASFTLPSALRASNDVKYTMVTAIASMWLCRIGLSYVFGSLLGFGVVGVWFAMFTDWIFRGISFTWRFFSGKWKQHGFGY